MRLLLLALVVMTTAPVASAQRSTRAREPLDVPTDSARWHYIASDANGAATFYDGWSGIRRGSQVHVVLWHALTAISPRRDRRWPRHDRRVSYESYDCARRSMAYAEYNFYLGGQAVATYGANSGDWYPWAPGSIVETIGEALCTAVQ